MDMYRMADEWMIEFLGEGRRRTDLIRMGYFVHEPWWDHTPSHDENLNRYPIPHNALSANNLLKQNPGYMTMKETASLLPKKDKQFQAHHQLIPFKLMRINHLLAGIGISVLSIASGLPVYAQSKLEPFRHAESNQNTTMQKDQAHEVK